VFQHGVMLKIFPLRISISGLKNCYIYNIPSKKSIVFVIKGVLEVKGNKVYPCHAKTQNKTEQNHKAVLLTVLCDF